jgi:acetyl esterase
VPLDPDAEVLRDLLAAMPPLETMTPDEARQLTSAAQSLSSYEGADVASVQERRVAGVPCFVITPKGTGPWPVLVWFHGGGWVIGSAPLALATTRDLAAGADCVVVSADYRLAPEHRFPAAYDDALGVTRTVLEETATFGGDPDRVAVGGDSAGGNLAACAALAVRGLRHQLLAYPVTDATMSQPSYTEMAGGYLLTPPAMHWFIDHYLGDADPKDPRVSPLFADEEALAGACPAHVVIAGYDPLRDEGEAYAARLAEAGVDTFVSRFEGQMHGMLTMGDTIPTGAAALGEACARLRTAFGVMPHAAPQGA